VARLTRRPTGGGQLNKAARRRLYVHIGMHKTGSTSIQAFCSQRRDELLGRGLLYAKTGLVPVPSGTPEPLPHHFVVALAAASGLGTREALLRGFDNELSAALSSLAKRENLTKLKQEIAQAGDVDVLVSSEHFWMLDETSVHGFCATFEDREIVPLIVLRNFADWWNSWYNTYVMFSRGTDTLANIRWKLDVVRACQVWSRAPGCDRLIAMDYDELSKSRDRFVEAFFHQSGISVDPSFCWDMNAENVSSAPWTIIFTRELRKSGASDEVIRALCARFDAIPRNGAYSFLTLDELNRDDDLFEQTVRELVRLPKVVGISVEGLKKKNRNLADIKVMRTLEDALSEVARAIAR
jgi:hypothetical protein